MNLVMKGLGNHKEGLGNEKFSPLDILVYLLMVKDADMRKY